MPTSVLGRLAPEFLLAGDLELDVEAAERAIDELADTLGLSRDRVAQGIVDVTNSNMAQALRLVSTDRGYDPRGATLVAYGGAGPLHACELARALQMPKVLIPLYPGAFSAFGALLADTRFDYTQTRWMRMSQLDVDAVGGALRSARGACRGRLPQRGLRRGAAARPLDRHALRRAELGAQRGDARRRR